MPKSEFARNYEEWVFQNLGMKTAKKTLINTFLITSITAILLVFLNSAFTSAELTNNNIPVSASGYPAP